MEKKFSTLIYISLLLAAGCSKDDVQPPPTSLSITQVVMDGNDVTDQSKITDVSLKPQIQITFSAPIDPADASDDYIHINGANSLSFSVSDDHTQITFSPVDSLSGLKRYFFTVSQKIQGPNTEPLPLDLVKYFYTQPDTTPQFPVISDDDLLTLVQQQTFKYFWDFADPNSGMAKERNTSGTTVTTGGSGFGVMAIIVGIERGFITRQQGLDRLDKILTFLESADRFHGAWSHWIDGNTGHVIPFSENDDGGDLVETAFMIQGLLTFRQYLNPSVPAEQDLIDRINTLWEGVEWDWYTQGGQKVLYWHWSPDKGWIMNFPIHGYDEALIVYVLAASSPTHPIDADVYTQGWAMNGDIQNGSKYYDITLPVGEAYGGPLFFAHYSFLGLDPRNLQDSYANYWTQNVNHSKINQAYCVDNPKDYVGYSEDCWGLTASDDPSGYSAHSPTNDNGTITPTAALSSFPYTPDASMKALKFFYYTLGDRTWGTYGFYDAFNVTSGWTASSYLAIDEGPIIDMIENYRTALLWDLFMKSTDVQNGLDKLGFTY